MPAAGWSTSPTAARTVASKVDAASVGTSIRTDTPEATGSAAVSVRAMPARTIASG
jgi:hypothetical protein